MYYSNKAIWQVAEDLSDKLDEWLENAIDDDKEFNGDGPGFLTPDEIATIDAASYILKDYALDRSFADNSMS